MFDAVYVINLPRSADRWRDLQPALAAMRVGPVIRLPAVEGATADLAALQGAGHLAADLSAFHANCRHGEIGCGLSHAAVLRHAVDHAFPRVLILEDDIVLAGNPGTWHSRAARAFADLPPQWDIWFLYRCFDIRGRVRRLTRRTVKPFTPQGCAAYALSLAGARKLLDAVVPLPTAIDRVIAPLVQTGVLDAYAASPLLIRPGSHPSIINAGVSDEKWIHNGVNRPPEYWPSRYLAHLGEPPEPWYRRYAEKILARCQVRL